MSPDMLDILTEFVRAPLNRMLGYQQKGELVMCDEKKDEVGLSEASKKILRWASWMGEVVCFFIDHGHEDDLEAMFHVMDAATSEIQALIGKDETDVSEALHSLRALVGKSLTDAEKAFVVDKVLEAIEHIKGASNDQ